MFLVSSCSCLRSIHWSHVLSWEWRCSWSSADRRCSNYIWVINNFIAYKGAIYIRGFTVVCNVLHVTLHVIWLSNSRFCCFNFHCNDVTRTPCRLNSSVSTLFVQLSYKWCQFSASLAICHWCLWGESTDHRWISLRRTGDTEGVFILWHHYVTQSLMCPTWTLSGFQMSTT